MNLKKPNTAALKAIYPLTKKNSLCHLAVGSNILKTLKTNLDLNKMRVEMSKKENSFSIMNQISDRISVSNKLDTIDTTEPDHYPIPNPRANNSKVNKGLLVYESYDKTQMDELTAIQNTVNEFISNFDSQLKVSAVQCEELWKILSLSTITQEDNVLLSMKNTIQSVWSLLYFSIIICYDTMNNNNNNNNEPDEKYLIQIKNAFIFHSKLIKIIKQHYPPFPLNQSEVIQSTQSMHSLLTSIASIHKSFFSIYPSDKYKEFFSLWSKIPQLPFDSLTLLYSKVKLNKDITSSSSASTTSTPTPSPREGQPMPQSNKVPLLSKQRDKEYTLVLDLDETLIYYEEDLNDINKGKVHYRPGLFAFLENVAPYYELILYTMSMKSYADSIVDLIEKDRVFFSKRLYRENCSFLKTQRVKDLNALGRDLKKTIIIDDNESNVILQKNNAILIKPYYGKDDSDLTLINLIPNLVKIAKEKMDIRVGLKMVKDAIVLPVKAKATPTVNTKANVNGNREENK